MTKRDVSVCFVSDADYKKYWAKPRILFLDFDGVLNSPATWGLRPANRAIDEDKIQRLSKLVEDLDAQIVVHSSWRYQFDAKDFREMLGPKGLLNSSRIIDVVPHSGVDDFPGDDVRKWLKSCWSSVQADSQADPAFVILDDLGLTSFDGLGRHLVQTDGSIGLTDEDCKRVVRAMIRQEKKS